VGEGAVILGLSELWFDKSYNRDALLSLVSRFADSSSHASVRSLAARFYRKWREPIRGDQAPSLTVLDAAGNETEVPAQFKRPVYLCFFAPESEVATAEMAALNELKKKWKDRLVPVAVLINARPEKLTRTRNALRLTYDVFLNKEFTALGDFRLKSDCTCMVLSPDGTYLMPKAPLPSEPDAESKLAPFTK
jgi:peroxiredoxin